MPDIFLTSPLSSEDPVLSFSALLPAHYQQLDNWLANALSRFNTLPTLQRTAIWTLLATLTLSVLLAPLPVQADGPLPFGSEFRVNTFTIGSQRYPRTAIDADGDFVVVWQSHGQDGSDFGVYAQRYKVSGIAQGPEFRVNTSTTGDQSAPNVAMDASGDFVVTWMSDDIYAQRYNAAGAIQGSEFQVNTFSSGSQGHPTVAMDADGNFVIAWESYSQDGSGTGVYAQRYDANGVAQGSEFQVNTSTTDNQWYPNVAMRANGDFVIVWMSDGIGGGAYAQRYDSNGIPCGGEFRVPSNRFQQGEYPRVVIDAEGNFVVVWHSFNMDGDGYGIYAQRYDASGAAQGLEFQINTYTANDQLQPNIAMDADGNFVVAWQSYGQDGSFEGIYAQRYNFSGMPLDGEFQVNTYTANYQQNPNMAMDDNGDFVVAWDSYYNDGIGYDIYIQQYASPRLALTKTVNTPNPQAGQRITYTLVISNRGLLTATNALISDTLPIGLVFAGPVLLNPPQAGAVLDSPPSLASNIVIRSDETITLTFPVTVVASNGVALTNTAAVSSSEISTPRTGSALIVVPSPTYLPLIVKTIP